MPLVLVGAVLSISVDAAAAAALNCLEPGFEGFPLPPSRHERLLFLSYSSNNSRFCYFVVADSVDCGVVIAVAPHDNLMVMMSLLLPHMISTSTHFTVVQQ